MTSIPRGRSSAKNGLSLRRIEARNNHPPCGDPGGNHLKSGELERGARGL
jgi:hypothetical protein